MNRSSLIALFDQDQRIDVEYPGTRREVTPNVVRHIDTSKNPEGMIIYSTLNEANAEDIISEQVKYFESIGQDFEWKVYDYDKPSDLKERLAEYGFVVEQAEALMVLDLNKAPEILQQPVVQNVQRIKDPVDIADILGIEQQVWNEDSSALGDYLREALLNYPDQMSVYVAYVDDKPASTAWVYFTKHSQFASLWGGASLSGYRKQGLYTALLAVRAQEARARQVRYLTVDASDMSRPILEKFGFKRMAWSYPCKWKRRPKQ
jgi:GNAT superfamily N-acetyltransferase